MRSIVGMLIAKHRYENNERSTSLSRRGAIFWCFSQRINIWDLTVGWGGGCTFFRTLIFDREDSSSWAWVENRGALRRHHQIFVRARDVSKSQLTDIVRVIVSLWHDSVLVYPKIPLFLIDMRNYPVDTRFFLLYCSSKFPLYVPNQSKPPRATQSHRISPTILSQPLSAAGQPPIRIRNVHHEELFDRW